VARLPGVRPNGVRPDVTLPPRGGRLGRARHVETAVDEEFAFHLDLRARELVGRGWAPDAARHEARRQFGDLDDARAYCRHLGELQERRMQRLDRLHVLRDDLRLALRALRRAPVFSLAVVITLALGIGATATTAGLVDRLLFRPPAHVRAPAELRRLYVTVTEGGRMRAPDASLSYPALAAVREALGPGRSVAAYSPFATTIGGGEQAEEARVTLASGDYFALLGVRAALGRTFGSAEDVPPAGQRVAVLSDDAWRRRFGAAPDVVGRAITIAGQRFEVVGVAPRGFVGTDLTRVDAWVPLSALAGTVVGQFAPEGWERAGHVDWIRALVRVPAAPPGAAAVAARALGAYRDVQERRVGPARAEALRARVSLEPLLLERGPDRTPAARLSVWLAAMAAVVLAIACANVTNLLLARAVRRRPWRRGWSPGSCRRSARPGATRRRARWPPRSVRARAPAAGAGRTRATGSWCSKPPCRSCCSRARGCSCARCTAPGRSTSGSPPTTSSPSRWTCPNAPRLRASRPGAPPRPRTRASPSTTASTPGWRRSPGCAP